MHCLLVNMFSIWLGSILRYCMLHLMGTLFLTYYFYLSIVARIMFPEILLEILLMWKTVTLIHNLREVLLGL